MDQAGPSSSNQDPRFDFIGSYAVKSLKLKPEKWMRVLSVEEHRSTLKDFVDKPFPVLLVVVLTHAAQLVPVISFPCYLKNKAVYYVKKRPDVVPKENCSEMVIFGKYLDLIYFVYKVLYSVSFRIKVKQIVQRKMKLVTQKYFVVIFRRLGTTAYRRTGSPCG